MKGLGMCSVLFLVIMYIVEVCDAECDEYLLVLEELSCSNTNVYKITPQKSQNITWEDVEYPCDSPKVKSGKKTCLVEFNCVGTELHCQDHIKVVNKQAHYFIADNQTMKPSTIRTEAPDVTKKIIVTEKPQFTLNEVFNASMYDVNLIFINDNDVSYRTETIIKTPRNETLYCNHTELVCLDEIGPKINELSDFNDTYNHDKETEGTLLLSIDRDETSPVQPIFTGYFPESSSDSSSNYNGHFKHWKTLSTSCSIPKLKNCKQKLEINVYLNVNYIENSTITKYPNCTKESNSMENFVNVKCEDILFMKNNHHIAHTPPTTPPTPPTPTTPPTPPTPPTPTTPPTPLTPPTPPTHPTPPTSPSKQKSWKCNLKSKDHFSANNNLHFTNCSKQTNIGNNSIKSGDDYNTPNVDRENITIPTTLTKNGTEINKTTTEEVKINNDTSKTHPENMVTILVTENANDCSQEKSLSISEGKIINIRVSNKKTILQNNNIELILSNCTNNNSTIINTKDPSSKSELTIILKNESLSASNLEQFNGTAEDKSVKQRILLRCDHPNNESRNIATINKTTLECESIDLDYYNITGIEINKNVSETTNQNINKEQKKENLTLVETVGIHNNSKLSNDKIDENNATVGHEEITKVPLDNKEVQKNISDAKQSKKTGENKGVQNLELTFNRRNEILNSAGIKSFPLGSPEREKIFLTALLTFVGVAILMAIVWRVWPKKREYDPAPTREPQDEEETAF